MALFSASNINNGLSVTDLACPPPTSMFPYNLGGYGNPFSGGLSLSSSYGGSYLPMFGGGNYYGQYGMSPEAYGQWQKGMNKTQLEIAKDSAQSNAELRREAIKNQGEEIRLRNQVNAQTTKTINRENLRNDLQAAALTELDGSKVAAQALAAQQRAGSDGVATIVEAYVRNLAKEVKAANTQARSDNPQIAQDALIPEDDASIKTMAFHKLGGEGFLAALEQDNNAFSDGVLAPFRFIACENTNRSLKRVYDALGQPYNAGKYERQKKLGGATDGAVAGAAIGSFAFPVGTAIGAVVGGIVGYCVS